MKLSLDMYITCVSFDKDLRPSLQLRFKRDINKSKYEFYKGYDLFQEKADDVRRALKHLSDADWKELLAYFKKCGLHFGMTEKECQEYMDSEFKKTVSLSDQFYIHFRNLVQTLCDMDDEEVLKFVNGLRENINRD